MAKTIEEMEEQERVLHARIAKKKALARKNERADRNHALIVAGGLLEKYAGEWVTWDYASLDAYLRQYQGPLKNSVARAEALPSEEAIKRCRAWEKEQREKARQLRNLM